MRIFLTEEMRQGWLCLPVAMVQAGSVPELYTGVREFCSFVQTTEKPQAKGEHTGSLAAKQNLIWQEYHNLCLNGRGPASLQTLFLRSETDRLYPGVGTALRMELLYGLLGEILGRIPERSLVSHQSKEPGQALVAAIGRLQAEPLVRILRTGRRWLHFRRI